MTKGKCKLLILTGLLLTLPFIAPTAAHASDQTQQPAAATVNGVVSDASGSPLLGVSVVVEGTARGVITDYEGNFSIKAQPDDILIFSYLGKETLRLAAGSPGIDNVVMQDSAQSIEDVIVIGYGTVTRKNAIGAVDQIKGDVMKDRPVGNVTQALQGASPNLIIQQRSMNPNDNSMNINIRGISTLSNNDPLLVVDGMVMDNVGRMNLINPSDIESISILKDAGSAAIYGSRSSNGIILITTRKGRFDQKPVVSFNMSIGTQNPDFLLTPVKGYQNALLRNDSFLNAGMPLKYSADEIAELAKGDAEWGYKAIFKNALQQNYNVSVQGGSKNTSYMVSFGYYDQESNYKGQDFGANRYNLRSSVTSQIGRFKLEVITGYDRSEKRDTPYINIADAMRVPTYPVYNVYPDSEGKFYANDVLRGNILATLTNGGITLKDEDHFQGVVSGTLDIWKGLSAKAVIGYDLSADHGLIRSKSVPVYSHLDREQLINDEGWEQNNSIEDYNSKTTMLNTQFMLNYDRTFGGKHQVTGLFGYATESYRRQGNKIKKNYVDSVLFLPTDKTENNISGGNTNNDTDEFGLVSWIGRVAYSYMSKYYFEANARYDASSKFTDITRWGLFPSVMVGWRISDENFFSFWKEHLGDLKLRSSYGMLGNQSVPNYQYFITYDIYPGQYAFNDSSVTGAGYTLANELLKWETTTSFDVGADASFLNNSLNVSYTFYHKLTKDILLKPLTPGTLGGGMAYDNLGTMRNIGWELSINYRLKHGEFLHNFDFNIGDTFNKVIKYGEQEIIGVDGVERIIREGVPLYSYYGYKTSGLFQNEEEVRNAALFVGGNVKPGDVRYVDRNGDGVIDSNDRYILGNAFPRYTFGFNYSFYWKGIDFSMLWQGVGKRDMALRGEMVEPFHASYYTVMFEHQLDYWRPDNTDAKYPRLVNAASPSYYNNYEYSSDRKIYNAAYIRLKNIQIGYTLPEKISSKVGMSKLRIYLTGQNLLTFSKVKFIDPESTEFGNQMNAGGANSGRNYPSLKYYGGGLEINF